MCGVWQDPADEEDPSEERVSSLQIHTLISRSFCQRWPVSNTRLDKQPLLSNHLFMIRISDLMWSHCIYNTWPPLKNREWMSNFCRWMFFDMTVNSLTFSKGFLLGMDVAQLLVFSSQYVRSRIKMIFIRHAEGLHMNYIFTAGLNLQVFLNINSGRIFLFPSESLNRPGFLLKQSPNSAI